MDFRRSILENSAKKNFEMFEMAQNHLTKKVEKDTNGFICFRFGTILLQIIIAQTFIFSLKICVCLVSDP
jgi:hypothetical protein